MAVKVLEHHEGVDQMEALLSSQISHPNVVSGVHTMFRCAC